MEEYIQVMTTTETEKEARRIARALVERRLAGCVQVLGPITSTYRREGEDEAAQEWLCLIKSRRDLYPELETAIRELHAYEVPEILALPVVEGDRRYLEWLGGVLR